MQTLSAINMQPPLAHQARDSCAVRRRPAQSRLPTVPPTCIVQAQTSSQHWRTLNRFNHQLMPAPGHQDPTLAATPSVKKMKILTANTALVLTALKAARATEPLRPSQAVCRVVVRGAATVATIVGRETGVGNLKACFGRASSKANGRHDSSRQCLIRRACITFKTINFTRTTLHYGGDSDREDPGP